MSIWTETKITESDLRLQMFVNQFTASHTRIEKMSIAHFRNCWFLWLFTHTRICEITNLRRWNSHMSQNNENLQILIIWRRHIYCQMYLSAITGQRKIWSVAGTNQPIMENIEHYHYAFRDFDKTTGKGFPSFLHDTLHY